MPEGPEVKNISDYLSKNFKGLILISFGYDDKSRYRNGFPKEDLFKSLLPLKLLDVFSKGKQIFFHFYSLDLACKACSKSEPRGSQASLGLDSNKEIYLNSNLGMEGCWITDKKNHSNFWLYFGKKIKVGKIYGNFITNKLYYDDSRHLGNLSLKSEEEFIIKWNKIGPDLLSEEISIELWSFKIKNPRIKNKQICDFLLNQQYFSNVGKSEILYDARIRPDKTLSQLSDEEIKKLLQSSLQKIKQSYLCGGVTIKSYMNPNYDNTIEKKIFPLFVYNQLFDPLGNKVMKTVFNDKRTTHWVPTLQQ